MEQGKTKRVFTKLFTAAFLVSSLLGPVPARASVPTKGTEPLKVSLPTGESKIEKNLWNEMESGEIVDVIIKMRQQPNLDGAIVKRQSMMGRKLSPIEQRKAVINELQVTAAESQTSLISQIKKATGKVESFQPFYIINAVHVKAEAQFIKDLANQPNVEKIFKNDIVELDEPIVSSSTDSNQEELEWNIEHIFADKVWDEFGIDGSGVLVGVIDSGINAMHPALRTKFKAWDPSTGAFDPALLAESFKDFTGNQTEPYDDPQVPHGSHVSGVIAGGEADGTNQIGVAPGATLIVGKALTAMGGSDAGLLGAAEWMLAPGGKAENAPRIVNNSWGGGANTDEWFTEVIETWRKAGILPVFAAGNRRPGEPLPWPGSLSNPANNMGSFSVAATDVNDIRASFSYIGPSLFDPTGKVIKPDISAPGVDIRSSVLGDDYMSMNGTSMAAPHVAGVAALMLQANPELTVDEIEEVIRKTAMPLTDKQFPDAPNMGYGHGNINAYDAVAEVLGIGTGKVTGNILTSGTDNEIPSMTIDYPTELYANQPVPLTLSLSDNVGITKATLKYRKADTTQWIDLKLERTEGNEKDGIYKAVIPANEATYPHVDILVEINDFGNHFDSQVLRLELNLGITPGHYFNDFENQTIGWKLENTWMIGEPEDSLEPDALSGKKVLGTNVGENSADVHPGTTAPPNPLPEPGDDGGVEDPGLEHPEGDFIAYAPPMDFREAKVEDAVLSFSYVFKNNPSTAKALVEITKDGKTWDLVKTLAKTGRGWGQAEVDLSSYVGFDGALLLRFRLELDGSSMANGLYIEDFRLGQTSSKANIGLSSVNRPQEITTQAIVEFPDNTLPIQGTIRVLETGRISDSDSLGAYSMRHAVEKDTQKWTVEASAYGFRSEQRIIHYDKDEEILENFILVPLGKDDIQIKVTDRESGEVISGAQVRLTDDSNYGAVITDATGVAKVQDVFEGPHHLRVFAPGYDANQSEIHVFGSDNKTFEIKLTPFTGEENVIFYGDDGTEDWWIGLAFVDPGVAFVNRFTAEKSGKVTAVEMSFTDTHAAAKGNEIGAIMLRANAKGQIVPVAAPLIVQVEPGEGGGKYNRISLEQFDAYVEEGEDFYLGTYQIHPQKDSPALQFKYAWGQEDALERAFVWAGELIPTRDPSVELDFWVPAIKAVVTEGERLPAKLAAPELTNVDYLTYTNESSISLKGKAPEGSEVTILDGETELGKVTATNGSFTYKATLSKDITKLRFQAKLNDDTSYLSKIYTMVLDQKAPTIDVETPNNNITVETERITLRGTAKDANIDHALVNGELISLAGDKFEQSVLLREGSNSITITAFDRAGNKAEHTLNVTYDRPSEINPGLKIHEMQPAMDVTLKPGQETTLSFKGNPGMKAYYQLTAPMGLMAQSDLRVPMKETTDGMYSATYTVPENVSGTFNVVFSLAVDDYEVSQKATGRLIIQGALSPRVNRVYGMNRFATAAELSHQTFETNDTVILAESDILADSVLAGPLSVAMNAPVLLTTKDQIPKETIAEIQRLKAKNVVVLGGKLAISTKVEDLLKKDYAVERLAGATRFETSVLVAKKVNQLTNNDSLFITNGHAFADSLVVGAVSQKAGRGVTPILFTEKDGMEATVRTYIEAGTWNKTWVVGGTLVVTNEVIKELEAYNPTRLAGATRYETSVMIAKKFNPNITRLALAEGSRGLDALTSAVYLANKDVPVLLTESTRLPEPVKATLSSEIFEVIILGGPSAVGEEVEAEIEQLLKK